MENSEELREAVLTMQREIDLLRIETTHAGVLLSALDAVLCVDSGTDPFAGVFAALLPVFGCSRAIVLGETDDGREVLECVAASWEAPVGTRWPIERLLRKVLSGRIISTVSGLGIDSVPAVPGGDFSPDQPALYLPLGVRARRGLIVLLRERGQPGFDRTDVTLARKFSLLASHAFAARQANLTEAESHRLKELTDQLKASQEALRFRANHDQLTGLPRSCPRWWCRSALGS